MWTRLLVLSHFGYVVMFIFVNCGSHLSQKDEDRVLLCGRQLSYCMSRSLVSQPNQPLIISKNHNVQLKKVKWDFLHQTYSLWFDVVKTKELLSFGKLLGV